MKTAQSARKYSLTMECSIKMEAYIVVLKYRDIYIKNIRSVSLVISPKIEGILVEGS